MSGPFTVRRHGSGPSLIREDRRPRGRSSWGKVVLAILAIVLAVLIVHPAFARSAASQAAIAAAAG